MANPSSRGAGSALVLLAGLTLASIASIAPAARAGTITFVDLVNPVGHLYQHGDVVTIGVAVDSLDSGQVTSMRFHSSGPPELVLSSVVPQYPTGWTSMISVGELCDLLDPDGLCAAAMYDPTNVGALLDQTIGILDFDLVSGSGAVSVGPLFAAGDAIEGYPLTGGTGTQDLTSSFDIVPAMIQVVPEPSTATFVALGLVFLRAWDERRRRTG